MVPNGKDILTTAKAAQLLGVSVRTVQLWVESGQLPSWKTPGGHRRIPRRAVLDLVEAAPSEQALVTAHAIILAGEGRALQWRASGLRGLGLLLDVTEDISTVRKWLASVPPMLIIIENSHEGERKRLVSALSNDARLKQTTIVRLNSGVGVETVKVRPQRLQVRMLSDVSATSAEIVKCLRAPELDVGNAHPLLWNEEARLEAVRKSGLVGSLPELEYDRLARLAAHATHSPTAMFTLITQTEQWFKARVGFEGEATPRDWAFCNETLFANELTVIEDLSKAVNFETNPTLSQPYGFRFYAGAPVRDPLGFALGSICVIDLVSRSLDKQEREALTTIAEAASNLLRLRILERELAETENLKD